MTNGENPNPLLWSLKDYRGSSYLYGATSSVTLPSALTTATNVWPYWNDKFRYVAVQSLTSAVSTTINTWVSWNYHQEMAATITNGVVSTAPIPESALQRLREEAENAKRQREIEQQRIREENFRITADRIRAKEKAEKLLQSALTPNQQEDLKVKGFFHCRSKIGRIYRIYRGSHGNVIRMGDNGKEIERLCVQPAYVPEGDCMLAQKLHIEHNEDEFRRTANITRLN